MVFAVFILARLLSSSLSRKGGGKSKRSILSYTRWTPASAMERQDEGPETEFELEMEPLPPDSGERDQR